MKVRCSHCGAVVTIDGSKDVEQKTIDEKAGVIATYAECPECNGEVCFQVDNMYTIDLAKKLDKQVRKVAELKAQKKFNAALYKETSRNIQKLKFKALTNLLTISGERVLVMKPVTYMNLSGEAVRPAADFYKIPPERILVISDDTVLDPGKLRIRQKGSAGGHNGLKNIIQHLGTDQFPRVRVGVGQKPHPDYDLADWVLGKFQGEDKKVMDEAVKRAADAVECILKEGADRAMNRFN